MLVNCVFNFSMFPTPPLLSTTVSNDSNFFPHLLPIQTSGIFANVSGSRSVSTPTSASTSTLVYKPFTFHFPCSKTLSKRIKETQNLSLSLSRSLSVSIYIPNPTVRFPNSSTPRGPVLCFLVVRTVFPSIASETMSYRPSGNSRTEVRRNRYKVAVDADEGRRRREDTMVEIRKNRREESLQKKRREGFQPQQIPASVHSSLVEKKVN